MQQIILINGGTTFTTHEEYMGFLREFEPKLEKLRKKSWKDSLQKNLGEKYEVSTSARQGLALVGN
ncbi:MAG: hypothetical protein WDZ75_01615 [Candidatus Paceibacterota bacterium]